MLALLIISKDGSGAVVAANMVDFKDIFKLLWNTVRLICQDYNIRGDLLSFW
jgi:hypothetical protein